MNALLPWTLASVASLGLGVGVLRLAWLRRTRAHALLAAGWALIVLGLAAMVLGWGGERGTAFGVLVLGVMAYGFIAATLQRRSGRTRSARDVTLDPEERSSNWLRAIGKALLSIVIAGIAAMGLGLVFAVHAPMAEVDRIVVGGLLVPLLWGAGMAWTLCDAKLLRAFALLVGVSALAYGAVFLPGVMA